MTLPTMGRTKKGLCDGTMEKINFITAVGMNDPAQHQHMRQCMHVGASKPLLTLGEVRPEDVVELVCLARSDGTSIAVLGDDVVCVASAEASVNAVSCCALPTLNERMPSLALCPTHQ